MPWAQQKIRDAAQSGLTELLGTEVTLGEVEIKPFDRILISDIKVCDDNGVIALDVSKIRAAFELWTFIATGRVVIDYALVDAPSINLYKDTPDGKLNIQGIIDRLSKPQNDDTRRRFEIKVDNAVIRQGRVDYRIISEGKQFFVDNLTFNAYSPVITPEKWDVVLEKLGFDFDNRARVDNVSLRLSVDTAAVLLRDLTVELQHTKLMFEDISVAYDKSKSLRWALETYPVTLALKPGSVLSLSDFGGLYKPLEFTSSRLGVAMEAVISASQITLSRFNLASEQNDDVNVSLIGSVEDYSDVNNLKYDISRLNVRLSAACAGKVLSSIPVRDKPVKFRDNMLLDLTLEGTLSDASAKIAIRSGKNRVESDVRCRLSGARDNPTWAIKGTTGLDIVEPQNILDSPGEFGGLTANAETDVSLRAGKVNGEIDLMVSKLLFKGYGYKDIRLEGDIKGDDVALSVLSDDRKFNLDLFAKLERHGNVADLKVDMDIRRAALQEINLINRFPGYALEGRLEASLKGTNPDDITGTVEISDVRFANKNTSDSLPSLNMNRLVANSSLDERKARLEINSDYLDCLIEGKITYTKLINSVSDIVGGVFPSLVASADKPSVNSYNDFSYDLTLKDVDIITRFFGSGVNPLGDIDINGVVSGKEKHLTVNVDMPYILQGEKVIDDTSIYVDIDGLHNHASLYATSHIPTKKGPMSLVSRLTGSSDRIDAGIDWMLEREKPLNGRFDLSTMFGRNSVGKLTAEVDFNPGSLNFGNEAWFISQSKMMYDGEKIKVDNFRLETESQSVTLNGTAGSNYNDLLMADLKNIDVVSIFETLDIDNVLICGRATGEVTGTGLLGSHPLAFTNNLEVKNIGYNYCVLGDGHIRAFWNNSTKSVGITAVIDQPNGRTAKVSGNIYPMTESLDLNFDTDLTRVGFLGKFMAAFSSDLSGYVSGKAHLYGTFSDINMTGDVQADSLRLKINFPNTYYTVLKDSVHIAPGEIKLSDITVYDIHGNTAKLNGVLYHNYFRDPRFDFRVTEARNFLSYNVGPKESPNWYGVIYGNGGATIKGWPGTVEIGVNMATAHNSVFTFVLSDRLDASDYSFITFRDKTPAKESGHSSFDDLPQAVKDYRNSLLRMESSSPSDYNINLQIDITPEAKMTIVMDPQGGDEIRATGRGNLRMNYTSSDNDLKMYGIYTLDHGIYNFTLQDIILKDFTILEGSSISFQGDPNTANLNINASYSVNANLSDLDESFLMDKDLTRTNVPVRAILKVTGDIRQPDIDFDLDFPTLTSDVYRKVRSIVSTKEMMNRQIIYLLALNRFYTPDYLSTTKGNELFSVASSTLSSQLSSILGKLSDTWSIAPNLRSDQGDFSDIEVDLALSSRLLNNRLLFNGNLGYRDKTLNANQFIGDFDIEYLLNRPGSWRLKAYNRYNDRNFYVRTATTTQGVGVMFKKDFDDMFSFLRKEKEEQARENQKVDTDKSQIDTVGTTEPDTMRYIDPVIFR